MNNPSGKHCIYINLLTCTALLAGCAAGNRGTTADAVRVLEADRPAGCSPAGTVHVSVADRLAQLQQVDGAVQRELEALARQSALQLGGNAIAALTVIDRGNQSFAVYRCP